MRLYIIGNGFDIAHNMKTSYLNFRDYIIRNKCPQYVYEDCESAFIEMFASGSKSDVAKYIVSVLDGARDDGECWNHLEAFLGNELIRCISCELYDCDINDERHPFREIYLNAEISECISNAFTQFRTYFDEWLQQDVATQKCKEKAEVKKMLISGECLFLNFNYTMTLEEVYGIKDVCHIHGKIDDEQILFGHGDIGEVSISESAYGADYNFSYLKEILRKDTAEAIHKNQDFFDSLAGVTEIYSYGFSFSDADMIYVDKIISKLNIGDLTWHLNRYVLDKEKEDVRKEIEERLKLRNISFKFESLW